MTEIAENHKNYSEKDWRKQTQKYEKFSGKWYQKFKDDLTVRDQIAVRAYQAKWHYYRDVLTTASTVQQLLETVDVKAMRERVEYFLENNMLTEIQSLYEEARQAGVDIMEAVAEIFDELQINLEELQK